MPAMRSILPLNRWNVLVLICTTLMMFCVAVLDYVTSPTLLLLYLAVQVIMSSTVRGYWWVVMAVVATGMWLVVRRLSPGADALNGTVIETWSYSLWNALQRLTTLGLVGFLCFRLRLYSRSPETFTSSHDSTGLLSASGLREVLSRRIMKERLAEGPVALLLLDAERRVTAYAGQSSEYGALVGAMVSKVLMSSARASDICARLSPNHFLIIMPGTDRVTAMAMNKSVQQSLPEIVHALGESVAVSSLLLTSDAPVDSLVKMRSYAQNRLITLKVMGLGKHHAEVWNGEQGMPFKAE